MTEHETPEQHGAGAPSPEELGLDPDASPFELPPVEGMPYDKGSVEDLAVQRVIEEADREDAAAGREEPAFSDREKRRRQRP